MLFLNKLALVSLKEAKLVLKAGAGVAGSQ